MTVMQITIGGIVAAGFLLKDGELGAKSAIYGAVISIVLSRLLSWGVQRAASAAEGNRKKSMAILYLGAAQRFLLALVLFGFGLGVLKLEPIALIAGFCFAQSIYLFSMKRQRAYS
jgi:ATP synthase protein I